MTTTVKIRFHVKLKHENNLRVHVWIYGILKLGCVLPHSECDLQICALCTQRSYSPPPPPPSKKIMTNNILKGMYIKGHLTGHNNNIKIRSYNVMSITLSDDR